MSELNFDVDFNNDAAIAPIAEAAWNRVRGDGDAAFAAAVGDFQRHLLAHCRSALRSNPLGGSTNMARFEQEVVRLREAGKK